MVPTLLFYRRISATAEPTGSTGETNANASNAANDSDTGGVGSPVSPPPSLAADRNEAWDE